MLSSHYRGSWFRLGQKALDRWRYHGGRRPLLCWDGFLYAMNLPKCRLRNCDMGLVTGALSAKEMGLENQWSQPQPQPTKRQAPDPGGEAATKRAEGKGER